ncbi:MAG: hypothetical protein NVSMB25_03400 [Thermoleophilaceae bacterium]
MYGLTVSMTLSRTISVAPTGISTARSACVAIASMPVTSARARRAAESAALRAVVRADVAVRRACVRVERALLLAARRCRVAAAFLAVALRAVGVAPLRV